MHKTNNSSCKISWKTINSIIDSEIGNKFGTLSGRLNFIENIVGGAAVDIIKLLVHDRIPSNTNHCWCIIVDTANNVINNHCRHYTAGH